MTTTTGTATTTASLVSGDPADRHAADDAQSIDPAKEAAMANSEPVRQANEVSEMASTLLSGASSAAIAAAAPPMTAPIHNDPFADLKKLRLSQDFVSEAAVKRVLSTVPIRKPNNQEFFRVRPEREYRDTFALINLKADEEFYLVMPGMTAELTGHFHRYVIYTCINRQNTLHLWPVRLPDPDGKDMGWWRTAHEAADLATMKWVNIKSNRDLGAYEFGPAPKPLPGPEWPEHTFNELLRAAFRDRLIDGPNHEVVRQLHGLI